MAIRMVFAKLLALALALVWVHAAHAGAGREVHVVLIAGQSNAVGADTMSNSYVALDYPAGVMQIGRFDGNDMQLIPARYPLDHHSREPGHFGIDLQFSIEYLRANPGVQLVLVPAGRGSTGFSTGQWGVGNPLYEDSVRRTNRALEEDNARLVAILWAQGEKDVRQRITREGYRAALDAQLTAWRRDIRGAENVPIILGQMVPAFIERRDRKGISQVIAETPMRIANTYVVRGDGAEVHGAATPHDRRDDELLHYSANGYRTMGARYAQVLLGLQ